MTILGIETTSRIAFAAVWRDGAVQASGQGDGSKKHAETILPLIETVLKQAGAALSEVDYIACGVGPGSFTGERIGVATANALAYALGKRVIGVDSLAVLAAGTEGSVCALIDALHGNAYCALFENGVCVRPPEAAALDALIPSLPEGTRLVGDVAKLCQTEALPGAESLCREAAKRVAEARERVLPLYLRVSQAERVRAQREARDG